METMWTFETARFRVTWSIRPSYTLDLSWDEDGATGDDIDKGLLTAFDSTVSVCLDGIEIATDTLGESIYENPWEFGAAHRDKNPLHRNCSVMREKRGPVTICHYFPDMVRHAIGAARDYLAENQPPYIRHNQEKGSSNGKDNRRYDGR